MYEKRALQPVVHSGSMNKKTLREKALVVVQKYTA